MTAALNGDGKGRRIGYARVSTDRQTTDQQIHALRQAGCRRVFADEGISATARHRPGLDAARRTLRRGDVIVVWAIDRAFRSTMEAILFLDDLMRRGIAFQSLTQAIDTRTPEGRKWFIDTASWAEYERAVISRRTKERLADAKRRGRHLGRPHKLDEQRAREAQDLIADGIAITDLAESWQVAPVTIRRALRRYGLEAG